MDAMSAGLPELARRNVVEAIYRHRETTRTFPKAFWVDPGQWSRWSIDVPYFFVNMPWGRVMVAPFDGGWRFESEAMRAWMP